MSADRFSLDTNILVYSVDSKAGAKQALAAEIIDRAIERDCALTLQALSEFYMATTRKGIAPKGEAAAQVEDWLALFPVLAPSAEAVRVALAQSIAGVASYWDALLVATAEEGGCVTMVSDDMHGGGRLGGVTILSPFVKDTLADQVEHLLAGGQSAKP